MKNKKNLHGRLLALLTKYESEFPPDPELKKKVDRVKCDLKRRCPHLSGGERPD